MERLVYEGCVAKYDDRWMPGDTAFMDSAGSFTINETVLRYEKLMYRVCNRLARPGYERDIFLDVGINAGIRYNQSQKIWDSGKLVWYELFLTVRETHNLLVHAACRLFCRAFYKANLWGRMITAFEDEDPKDAWLLKFCPLSVLDDETN